MRKRSVAVLAAGLAVTAAAAASFGQPAPPPPPQPPGYLSAATQPDTLKILPPSPKARDPQDVADHAVFAATRSLQGGSRWELARNDDRQDAASMLADFSCAVGVAMTPANAPTLTAILGRVRTDEQRAVDQPKNVYMRPRPYLGTAAPLCIARSDLLNKSPDYPSGHATWSWTIGLILAEIAPDRITPIMVRARSIGESRVVCGVHNPSAVTEGRTDASVVVAALHGAPEFRSDLARARAELTALRSKRGAPPAACPAENALIAAQPW